MVYLYEGSDVTFINEKFENYENSNLKIYIWKGDEGQLGFNTSSRGIDFMKKILLNSETIILPEVKLIQSDKDLHYLKGVSFFSNKSEIKTIFEDYRKYLISKKKNDLLIRYDKVPINIDRPIILNWIKNMKYTSSFVSTALGKKNILWDWSNFGTYFFEVFNKSDFIEKEVMSICDSINIEFHKVDDFKEIPHW